MFVRIFISFILLLISCKNYFVSEGVFTSKNQTPAEFVTDTLRVATLYGSSSYFNYGSDELMGYDYELATNFAEQHNFPIKFYLASTEDEMKTMLRRKQVDLIAYDLYETKALKKYYDFVAHQDDSYMVLVQEIGVHTVSSLDELRGRTIHVIENSIFHERLKALNKEMDNTIDIQLLNDSVTVDQAINMVLQREIAYTLAYYKTATQYKEFFRRLDCRVAIGLPQKNGWLISKYEPALKLMFAAWETDPQTELFKSRLFQKYKIKNPYFMTKRVNIPRGAISPYDNLFKFYAQELQWDWRILAAIAYRESGFDSTQVSRVGASGLMQLMPTTAARFGLEGKDIFNPELNISAGVQYLKSLNMMFRRIEDKEERMKFMLASYNSGPAHILDAMALAEKYGKNPHIWFEHVEYYLSKSNDPEYYNDEVVRYGKFGPTETIRYVRNTLNTYEKYKERV